ncbi:MAG: hypothetical protein ACXWW7_02280 [Nocardioides sp.]
MSEINEVERLRARVAELESRLSESAATPEPSSVDGGGRSAWRGVISAFLLILACVLAPLSVASVWASTQLSDSGAYVETVAPLAEDPAVQAAVADEVTAAIVEDLDVETVATDALEALAAQEDVPPRVAALLPGLAVPLTNGVESFTRTQVGNLLASPQFAEVWAQVNRVAHEQVVKLLEGNEGGVVTAQDDTITLNLAPIIEQVKTRLVDQGFSLAANIPAADRQFVLVQNDAITQAQGFYQFLNTLGVWLPFIAVALFAAGVLLARDRRRALLKGALGVTVAMVVLGAGLTLVRMYYVETTPADILTEEAAGNVFDTLIRFLRTGIRATAVAFLLIALVAFLSGPSSASVRSRRALEHGIGSLRGEAESAGFNTGRFGTWTYAHRRSLRIGTFIAAGLLLMFWTQPTAWTVVGVALLVALLLALIEFLAHPPVEAAAGSREDTVRLPTQRDELPTQRDEETRIPQ